MTLELLEKANEMKAGIENYNSRIHELEHLLYDMDIGFSVKLATPNSSAPVNQKHVRTFITEEIEQLERDKAELLEELKEL